MDKNAFTELFTIYVETTQPEQSSIGAHLRDAVAAENANDPLVIVTGSQLIAFVKPGDAPRVHDFRLDVKGFFEMAAISHLGPALASLVALSNAGADTWRADAERLARQLRSSEEANSPAFWRSLDVAAWKGKEDAIVRMVAYALRLSSEWLEGFRRDAAKRSFDALVEHYLAVSSSKFPISYDQVMVATFALATLGGVSGSLDFLRSLKLDWRRALVVFAGQTGGATAGLNRETNHLYDVLFVASRGALAPERVLFNPFSKVGTLSNGVPDTSGVEAQCRAFWATTTARTELAGRMFPQYPKLAFRQGDEALVTPLTRAVTAPPRATAPDDLFGFVARLRFMMEDPTRLLSSTVAPYVLGRLACGDRPEDVVIPGFTGVSYPLPAA